MIDLYADDAHDVAALAPIWWGLGPDERGVAHAAPAAANAARREGLWPLAVGTPNREADRPLLVTERTDPRFLGARPLVILDGSFAEGGNEPDLGHLVLAATPLCSRAIPVGVPRLDWLHRPGAQPPRPTSEFFAAVAIGPLDLREPEHVAVLDGWAGALQALAAIAAGRGDLHVLVHGSPDVAAALRARVREVDERRALVTYCERLDLVYRLADVLASDHRAWLYEFAGYIGPVVPLCDPWRPDPAPLALGRPATHPGMLAEAISVSLEQTAGTALRRQQEVRRVYPLADGHATERAVDAIRRYTLA